LRGQIREKREERKGRRVKCEYREEGGEKSEEGEGYIIVEFVVVV